MVTKTPCQEPIWHTPNALWNQIAPILGPDKPPGTVGRPATPNRVIFDALIFVLCSGCPWQALPRPAYPPGSTVHGRFRQWVEQGVFLRAWQTLLHYYRYGSGHCVEMASPRWGHHQSPLGRRSDRSVAGGPGETGHQTVGDDRPTRRPAGRANNRCQYARQNGGSGDVG